MPAEYNSIFQHASFVGHLSYQGYQIDGNIYISGLYTLPDKTLLLLIILLVLQKNK